MFDLDDLMTTTDYDICVTEVTLKDMRSGETFNRTIFRPGKALAFQQAAKEFGRYGYEVIRWGDSSPIPGKIDWSKIFGHFVQGEPA